MSKFKKILACFLMLILLSGILVSSVQATEKNNIPYDSYSQWRGQGTSRFVVQKAVYQPTVHLNGGQIDGKPFDSPTNMATAKDKLYILDSENSRIVILDQNFKLIQTIETLTYQGEQVVCEKAEGIYVNSNEEIYIADTEGERILICNSDGNVEKIITAPKSDIIPADMSFQPIEMAEDEDGYLFVLCKGVYYGAMVFDKDGTFQSFFGASRVEGSIMTIFTRLIDNIFGTDERREASLRKLPFEFSDICYKDGFIYTASTNTKNNAGQLKKLSFSGENILVSQGELADNFAFGDQRAVMLEDGSYIGNRFSSLEVDENGFIYALDDAYGKIFVYDSECNLITAFGGGMSSGVQMGNFQNACDIALLGNKIVVLDKGNGTVTGFERTKYGNLFFQAVALNKQGNYQTAKPIWEEILSQDSYNQLAYPGLANGYLMESNYEKALDYAKKGYDRDIYERAFEELRRTFLAKNFFWILPLIILILGGLVTLIIYTSKHKDKHLIKNEKLRTFFKTLIHPIDSFYNVKYEGKGSVLISSSMMLLYFIFNVLAITAGGFMYVSYDPMKYNSGLTFLGTTVVALLFCIVNLGVCTLAEGKGRLKEIFIVTGYSLLPQIIYKVIFIIGSYFLVYSESTIFFVLEAVSWIATIVILLIGLVVVHDYSFFKAVGMAILTVIGMALVAFIVVLVLTLFQDLFQFIDGAVKELLYRYMG